MLEGFHLARVVSDHCAIGINCGDVYRSKAIKFRFELSWCKEPSFLEWLGRGGAIWSLMPYLLLVGSLAN